MTNGSRGVDKASMFWLLLGGAVLAAWFVILGALGMLSALGWLVHPLAAGLLALYASLAFVPSAWRRPLPILVAVGGMFALCFTAASWVVHPLAGVTIGLMASTAFTGKRRDLPRLVFAVAILAISSIVGASWAMYPLVILGIIAAFLAPTTFSRQRKLEERRAAKRAQRALTLGAQPLPSPSDAKSLSVPMLVIEEGAAEKRPEKQARRRARRARRQAPEPVPSTSEPTSTSPSDDVTPTLSALLARDGHRLPLGAHAKLTELRSAVREGLAYLREHDAQNTDSFHLLSSIADDYAPTAVRAYLRLPASLANVTPLQDGKTGSDLLTEQLDVLLAATRDVMTNVAVRGGQDLLAHRRFLEDKFRRASDDFDI
ncbi:hypothetical protein [Deinococcus yavapaiensis]|uniref:Uncharacterized protein n=1 Tax=Deinococcus yavapaiensis KR-236 TaxID=694435 RepID=A0A318SBS6_9DEIO|nr:hypothetical protein [Deinococcus yavapaiensis]PYE54734.1 hypothetical protein DES52_1044 [Deinococcus yavapaiensis KR-236]